MPVFGIEFKGGYLFVPQKPRLGIEPDVAAVKRAIVNLQTRKTVNNHRRHFLKTGLAASAAGFFVVNFRANKKQRPFG